MIEFVNPIDITVNLIQIFHWNTIRKYVSVWFQFGVPTYFGLGTQGAKTEITPKCDVYDLKLQLHICLRKKRINNTWKIKNKSCF